MSDTPTAILACGIGFLVAFGGGCYVTSNHYNAKMAEMEQARIEAVSKVEKKNASNLSDATNTILLAQAEYSDLRGELDRALARLRHADSSGRANASSDALGKRVAALEELVSRLAESGTKCGEGWQRSAERHDALAEAVK